MPHAQLVFIHPRCLVLFRCISEGSNYVGYHGYEPWAKAGLGKHGHLDFLDDYKLVVAWDTETAYVMKFAIRLNKLHAEPEIIASLVVNILFDLQPR